MSPLVIGLLLAAALIHAIWNAMVKSSEDRLWSICVIAMFGVFGATPFVFVFDMPHSAAWPYIATSGVLQAGYCLFLARAYQIGDLAQVYPIARGSAPLLVTVGAAALANELPGTVTLAGIGLVSLGILALALGSGRASGKAFLTALATGGFIASYMVTDGLGVRLAGNALGYAAWQSVISGSMLTGLFVVVRRKPLPMPRGSQGWLVAVAGVLATLGYCIAVWAMSLSGMGSVSALRETSIVFAALIAVVFLKERMTPLKWIGVASVTAGVMSLSL